MNPLSGDCRSGSFSLFSNLDNLIEENKSIGRGLETRQEIIVSLIIFSQSREEKMILRVFEMKDLTDQLILRIQAFNAFTIILFWIWVDF